MPRLIPCLAAAGSLVLLAGCSAFDRNACHDRQPYQAAEAVPPLKVPEGLAAPSTRNALRIPEVQAEPKRRSAGDPCLDEPPSFYPDRPKPGQRPAAE
ncbi:MAG: hypothetical protein O9284_09745 [Steroidobacteraceae bacterium]|jgi:uncharacterized lipoprotein|nr:hypothetical protein [Steroidobacteraceae bacterium]